MPDGPALWQWPQRPVPDLDSLTQTSSEFTCLGISNLSRKAPQLRSLQGLIVTRFHSAIHRNHGSHCRIVVGLILYLCAPAGEHPYGGRFGTGAVIPWPGELSGWLGSAQPVFWSALALETPTHNHHHVGPQRRHRPAGAAWVVVSSPRLTALGGSPLVAMALRGRPDHPLVGDISCRPWAMASLCFLCGSEPDSRFASGVGHPRPGHAIDDDPRGCAPHIGRSIRPCSDWGLCSREPVAAAHCAVASALARHALARQTHA